MEFLRSCPRMAPLWPEPGWLATITWHGPGRHSAAKYTELVFPPLPDSFVNQTLQHLSFNPLLFWKQNSQFNITLRPVVQPHAEAFELATEPTARSGRHIIDTQLHSDPPLQETSTPNKPWIPSRPPIDMDQ